MYLSGIFLLFRSRGKYKSLPAKRLGESTLAQFRKRLLYIFILEVIFINNISKKICKFILTFLCCCIVLLGYNSFRNRESANNNYIKDISNFSNKVEFNKNELILSKDLKGYGIKILSEDGNMIKDNKIHYKGKPLNYYISFTNANEYEDSIGFMIIVDGKVQPFFVDKQNNSKIIHNETLKPYSLINIPITFSPIIDSKNKNHSIYFLSIYNQNKVPSENIKFVDYYAAPYMCNLDIENISDKDLCKDDCYKILEMNEKPVSESSSLTSIIKLDDEKKFVGSNKVEVDSNNDNTIFRFIGQIPSGLYSTIVFVDNKPIKIFNDKEYFIWKSSNDKTMMFYDFKLPFKLEKGNHQIYSITLPVYISEYKSFFESTKVSIEVK